MCGSAAVTVRVRVGYGWGLGVISAGPHIGIILGTPRPNFLNTSHRKLESLVNRCRRLGYRGRDELTLSELYSEADDRMFNGVVINPEHVLPQFLTEREQTYNLRRRPHGSKTLLTKPNHLMNRISLLGLCINIV